MKEGVRRIATVVRWLSLLWLAGAAVLTAVGIANNDTPRIGVAIMMVVVVGIGPAALGLALAWIIDGFAKTD
jgi:hypothetical protein